jgi:hypothetical protein
LESPAIPWREAVAAHAPCHEGNAEHIPCHPEPVEGCATMQAAAS